MKSLKLKSLKSSIFIVIILLLVGGVMLFMAAPTMINLVKGPTPLEEVDYDDDLDGLYVEGTLTRIYGAYAETEENYVEIISREYIIDGGESYYMGMLAKGDDMEPADELMYASFDYMDGYDDGTALEEAQYTVSGTIIKIPDDSLEYYLDAFYEDQLDIALPYYLVVGNVGRFDLGTGIAFTIIGALAVFGGLFFLIRALTGKEQKYINKYINESSDPEVARQKIESFLENVPEVDSFRYNHEFILGGATAFGETSKLIWAYQHTTTHKRNFITVGKTYSVVIAFTDGSRQTVSVKSEAVAQQHLEKLSLLCPRAIIGYTADLDSMFRKNFQGFLDLRYNRVLDTNPMPVNPASSNPTQPTE